MGQASSERISTRSINARRHILALVGYTLLSVVTIWPVPLHFTTHGLGELYSDRAEGVWNFWWVRHSLFDLHASPFRSELLLYPHGADLYFHLLNIPMVLVVLPVLLVFGQIAAYNCTALLALALSGYAAFRLVSYISGNYAAALVAGLIVGFNPLSQAMLWGEINVVCLHWFLLCIEFYLRAWAEGKRRYMVLTGIFFALAVLTTGYFEALLLIFFALHSIWLLATSRGSPGEAWFVRIRKLGSKALPLLGWGGGTAIVALAPYLLGAWLSLRKGDILLWTDLDDRRVIADSANLLGFIVPSRNHWLLGAHAPWWGFVDPNLRDFVYIGFVTLGLATLGVWRGRRQPHTWLWVALALSGALLALGPILQINDQQRFWGVHIPMPFGLFRAVPPLNLVRAPERFMLLAYLALGVLASGGVLLLLERTIRKKLMLTGVLALLLLEMPLHERYIEPMPIPASLGALSRDRTPGAVLELPLTQHGHVDAQRMYYQTAHGRPITSAYLSRAPLDPYRQACSPLLVFHRYSDLDVADIVSPTITTDLLPSVLTRHGFGFVVVYKQTILNERRVSQVPQGQLSALQELANQLGTRVADDDVATTYRVHMVPGYKSPFAQLGNGWHSLEESQGKPFRWMGGGEVDICVFSPTTHVASVHLLATSFAGPRHLQLWVGERKVMEELVPADGAMHSYSTPPLTWPTGPQHVRLVVPEGSDSPSDLQQGSDTRRLSIGFSVIALEQGGP